MTEVELAGKTRGQFLMARSVRQGCLASVFLFGMAFDPIFRWLHGSVITRDPAAPDFLQPAPCAYADDFTVQGSSFRSLMNALSPAFEVVDSVAGLNLNHRKCSWVQHGNDRCQDLLEWVSTNCEEFREMKIVKHAKHVGTLIGPEVISIDGLHREKNSFKEIGKSMGLPEVQSSDWLTSAFFALSVIGHIGSISVPDGASLKEEAHALQCTTASSHNAIPTDLLRSR